MHDAVLDWVRKFSTDEDLSVLDIGGRNLNGSTRHLFPNAEPYHVLDLHEGRNVDIVADAADWTPDHEYDLVVCTETFEHTAKWRRILQTAWSALRPGGWLVFTCAGPGRPQHSGITAVWELAPGEWYANVSPEELIEELQEQGWTDIEVRLLGTDTQGVAIKPAVARLDTPLGAPQPY